MRRIGNIVLAGGAALALLAATPALAGERGNGYANGNGYGQHHYKPKHHGHYKPHFPKYPKHPKEPPRAEAPRLELGCGKAYAVGPNCYDPMAGFDGPRFLGQPLRTLNFVAGEEPVNWPVALDAGELALERGRVTLR